MDVDIFVRIVLPIRWMPWVQFLSSARALSILCGARLLIYFLVSSYSIHVISYACSFQRFLHEFHLFSFLFAPRNSITVHVSSMHMHARTPIVLADVLELLVLLNYVWNASNEIIRRFDRSHARGCCCIWWWWCWHSLFVITLLACICWEHSMRRKGAEKKTDGGRESVKDLCAENLFVSTIHLRKTQQQ